MNKLEDSVIDQDLILLQVILLQVINTAYITTGKIYYYNNIGKKMCHRQRVIILKG